MRHIYSSSLIHIPSSSTAITPNNWRISRIKPASSSSTIVKYSSVLLLRKEVTKEYGAALSQLTDNIYYADLEANDHHLFERWQLGATQPSRQNAYYWDYARYAEVRDAYQEKFGDLEMFEHKLNQYGNWTRSP